MTVSIEVRTTSPENDAVHVKKAMINMASLFGDPLGYKIGESSKKIGWTFYTIHISDSLYQKINAKFDDMIQKCAGRGSNDKFIDFMTKYFDARGAKVNLKLLAV